VVSGQLSVVCRGGVIPPVDVRIDAHLMAIAASDNGRDDPAPTWNGDDFKVL